jgi:hypothetical protein
LESYKIASALAIVAGLLLILANAVGSVGFIGIVLGYMIEYFSGYLSDILFYILQLLNLIASLGGVAVIGGGVLIYIGRLGSGNFFIGLGAGIGLISYLIAISSAIINGWAYTVTSVFLLIESLNGIGIFLAIVSTVLANK